MARMISAINGIHEQLSDAQGASAGNILRFVQIQGGATVDASSIPSDKWVCGISGELMDPSTVASITQDL